MIPVFSLAGNESDEPTTIQITANEQDLSGYDTDSAESLYKIGCFWTRLKVLHILPRIKQCDIPMPGRNLHLSYRFYY